MAVNLQIPALKDKFQDYRDDILGDSYNWGPVINPANVKYFAFHHSVTPQTAKKDGNWKAECDRIAQEHVNGNGWGGIGYRFVICSDGTIASPMAPFSNSTSTAIVGRPRESKISRA